uniref:Uncharacterized protein n=1 Tax=Arundo donax TaxID=35708 RepID=A0A0A9CB49_ARUDO
MLRQLRTDLKSNHQTQWLSKLQL